MQSAPQAQVQSPSSAPVKAPGLLGVLKRHSKFIGPGVIASWGLTLANLSLFFFWSSSGLPIFSLTLILNFYPALLFMTLETSVDTSFSSFMRLTLTFFIFTNPFHHLSKLFSPTKLCNLFKWATDLQAGSKFGNAHLFILFIAICFAVFLQILACRLGFISGQGEHPNPSILKSISHSLNLIHLTPTRTLTHPRSFSKLS